MFSNLSLILTGGCNFSCSYCYQEKDDLFLDPTGVERAIEFFFPRFENECSILFYGGEPLLAKDTIKSTVHAVKAENRRQRKNIQYSISTNGSLLDDDTLRLFDKNRFTVLLSFDGRAQEKGRKKGSFPVVSGALERLLDRPRIELLTNSVFTPETVADLSASIRDIVERGVRDAQISFTNHRPWGRDALARLGSELSDLRRFLLAFRRKKGYIPVTNFRASTELGIFGCRAGEDRMALSPDGRLWGCHLFYDFHKKMKSPTTARYCFGDLDFFITHDRRIYPRILARYADLRMDYFHTPEKFCGLCRDVHDCVICPVDAAFASGIIGRIMPVDCGIRKIVRKEKQRLWKDLENYGIHPGRARTDASKRRLRVQDG
ncbi:MAG: radical SAM protein [Candidatus Aminicenantes bacterium]|nr:radical SAM protein [Candidatus Aminicenantes bacterium]